jgi:hypothetical protein
VEDDLDKFDVYDDNNLSHVVSGPDYGQVGNTELKWTLKAPTQPTTDSNLTINAINSKNILINVLKV